MAKFTPQDTKQLDEGGGYDLLPVGDYDFEVTKAEDGLSKSGNEQIKLTLAVYQGDRKYTVWDYLTFTEKSQWKAYSFCKATELVEEFKAGELSAFHCGGRIGELKIGIQKAQDEHPEKNTVKSYIPKEEAARAIPGAKPTAPDDDIPF